MSDPDSRSFQAFVTAVSRRAEVDAPRHAIAIQQNVPIYSAAALREQLPDDRLKRQVMEELIWVLEKGPGVFVLEGAYANLEVIDQATAIFEEIIADERSSSGSADHFAEAGANDRIWNALEKLCLTAPDVFARYYANDMIALAAQSWLGPWYQMTSQINVVRPGGGPQVPHCDYHLGFQTVADANHFPMHVHRMSTMLTLQGAIAHCDMPVESGPTRILPYSQTFEGGYLAWRREEFIELFEARHSQLPLKKGDAMFFNPALFHAAGANRTGDVARMANLLQISSAFGRAMERVDRTKMCEALYATLLMALENEDLGEDDARRAIAASAEGYSFPTNLDRNPPIDGLAPESQASVMLQALLRRDTSNRFRETLRRHAEKSI